MSIDSYSFCSARSSWIFSRLAPSAPLTLTADILNFQPSLQLGGAGHEWFCKQRSCRSPQISLFRDWHSTSFPRYAGSRNIFLVSQPLHLMSFTLSLVFVVHCAYFFSSWSFQNLRQNWRFDCAWDLAIAFHYQTAWLFSLQRDEHMLEAPPVFNFYPYISLGGRQGCQGS